jgi:hypothetical protein
MASMQMAAALAAAAGLLLIRPVLPGSLVVSHRSTLSERLLQQQNSSTLQCGRHCCVTSSARCWRP